MTKEDERTPAGRSVLDFERSLHLKARRNALLGAWLATHTGRDDNATITAAVLKLAARDASDEDLCDELLADLTACGHAVGREGLRAKLHSLTLQAAEQIASERPVP